MFLACSLLAQSPLSIVRLTSRQLEILSKPTTTKGVILRFSGMVILALKFEFEDRPSLWATTVTSKYIPAPLFGKTNLSQNRFDDLWRCVRFSDQQSEAEGGQIMSEQGLLHGAKVVQDLVMPWMHYDRVAYGNSYFSSVPAARMMMRYGMGFIGVVKSASRQYPMPYLSQVELNNRGDRKGMVTRGGQTNSEPKMMAFCLDGSAKKTIFHCNLFFACGREPLQTSAMEATWGCIFRWTCQSATCWFSGSSTKSGRGLRQNMCYNWLPQSSSTGYAGDWSKLVTQNWSMRVNLTVFSMIAVDSWLAYSQCKGKSMVENQKKFYTLHAQELIDSRLDVPNVRLRMSIQERS